MARPKGKLNWASDAAITDTGVGAWDGEPPQVEPSDAIKAQGFRPGREIATGFANYAMARIESEGTYQDAIEVQNWTDGVDTDNSTAGTDPISGCFVDAQKKHYFGFNASIVSAGPQGKTYTAETLPGSGPATMILIETNGTHIVYGGGIYAGFGKWNGSAWALVATAGINNYLSAVGWNPSGGGFRFMLGANATGAGAPRIITLATDMATTATITKSLPSGYTQGLVSHMIAAANTLSVNRGGSTALSRCIAIMGWDGTGPGAGGLQMYYSDDAVTWTSNRVTSMTLAVSDAWWDDCRLAFYLVDSAGNLWSSDDGITWADTTVNVPNDSAKWRTIAQHGGVWVMVGSTNRLLWSVDAGVSWHEVYDTFGVGPTGTQPFVKRHVVLMGERFACLASPTADDNHAISFALRCR